MAVDPPSDAFPRTHTRVAQAPAAPPNPTRRRSPPLPVLRRYACMRAASCMRGASCMQTVHAMCWLQTMFGRSFGGDAFLSSPEEIVFKDFEVGQVYSATVAVINRSYRKNSFRCGTGAGPSPIALASRRCKSQLTWGRGEGGLRRRASGPWHMGHGPWVCQAKPPLSFCTEHHTRPASLARLTCLTESPRHAACMHAHAQHAAHALCCAVPFAVLLPMRTHSLMHAG